jgi:rod shape-determining protein MreC
MANGTWRSGRARSGGRVSLLLAGIVSVLLLIAGKVHFLPVDRARTALTDRAGTVFQAVNAPVLAVTRWFSGIGHFFSVYSENQALREENARLTQWRGAALALQNRVNHYRLLLKMVPDVRYSAVTAQVIARSSQPFLETIVLNAGKANGINPGEAVIDARGMLGRIYVAGDHTAWVVLLTDLNSRIPVEIRPGNIPAILAGNNTDQPVLDAIPQNAKLRDGADIVTSGDGGLLPAGLPIGILRFDGKQMKVALYSDPLTAVDVRILDYRAPIEQMPKPADSDLPAPPKLSPPPPPTSPLQPSAQAVAQPSASAARAPAANPAIALVRKSPMATRQPPPSDLNTGSRAPAAPSDPEQYPAPAEESPDNQDNQ